MKVLITRPEGDAVLLAQALLTRGHEVRLAPLLKIVPRTFFLPAKSYQGACFTSANGLVSVLDMPAFCVGAQSSAKARSLGYREVHSANGDVAALVELVVARCSPDGGPLLYLSGAETSGDLEGQLRARGFDVDRVVAYEAVAMPPFDLDRNVAWADVVMLYSPRTAKLWSAAISGMDAGHLWHLCLSDNVARQLPSARCVVAQTPDESAMFASLDRMAEHE